jgi:hypothetical protein
MTKININLPLVVSVLHSLAGVAGAVLTPVYGSQLSTASQGLLLAISALLVAIPGYHVASVAAATAKAKIATPVVNNAPVGVALVPAGPVPTV